MKNILLFCLMVALLASCGDNITVPPNNAASYNADTSYGTSNSGGYQDYKPETAAVAQQAVTTSTDVGEDQKSDQLSLTITEKVNIDRNLVFYAYSASGKPIMTDQTFKFVLDDNVLTMIQITKNTGIATSDKYHIKNQWSRELTLEYNKLKNVAESDLTKTSSNLEIGMKNSKVKYIKLGTNKFFVDVPVASSFILSTTKGEATQCSPSFHIVKEGENVKYLAEKYCVEVKDIIRLNNLDSNKGYAIYPKQNLRIK